MIVEYRNRNVRKAPGPWFTYTYENGIRVTLAEYQGSLHEIEDFGRSLSKKKGREVRVRIHQNGTDRLHAVFKGGLK